MRERLRAARLRAFEAYEARYGQRYHRDTRPEPDVVMVGGDPALQQWVVDLLRARNEGITVIPPLPE